MTKMRKYVTSVVALSLVVSLLFDSSWAKRALSKSPLQSSAREPTAEGYENTDIPMARKFLGEELQELVDPTGSLDEQTPFTNLVEDMTGDNVPSPGSAIGGQLQKVIGEHDMSDQEVLQYLSENEPKVQHLIDVEQPEKSMERLNKYHTRRLRQEQRKAAHGTRFPELRTYLTANASDPKIRREISGMDDEELTRMYINGAYKNQGVPEFADVVDDMIAEGKERFQEMKEDSENIVTATSSEDLSKKVNELEDHISTSKENGESPYMLVHYRDDNTGADLLFASPERMDQYMRERRWRSLNYIDRGVVSEWVTAGAGRAVVLWMAAATRVARSGTWLFGKALGTGLDSATNQIWRLEGALQAIRQKSPIRVSDDEGDAILLVGQQEDGRFGLGVFGEGLTAVNLAARLGEAFGSVVPGVYFGTTLAKTGGSPR